MDVSQKFTWTVRLADNALVLAQRVAEWAGHGPVLEEDIALSNIGLDLLGQARMLYTYAGEIEGEGRKEDDLAYFRNEPEFRNFSLCELPNAISGDAKHDDYAVTTVRNMLYSAWAGLWWSALCKSSDLQIAAIAQKSIKETRAHWRHAQDWTIRLGDGTASSQARMQAAVNKLMPYCKELFIDDAIDRAAAAVDLGPLPSSLSDAWLSTVSAVLTEATLTMPAESKFLSKGREGYHTEHLSYLLSEMQSVARAHPGAVW